MEPKGFINYVINSWKDIFATWMLSEIHILGVGSGLAETKELTQGLIAKNTNNTKIKIKLTVT